VKTGNWRCTSPPSTPMATSVKPLPHWTWQPTTWKWSAAAWVAALAAKRATPASSARAPRWPRSSCKSRWSCVWTATTTWWSPASGTTSASTTRWAL